MMVKKIFRSERSPVVQFLIFLFSVVSSACSPFDGHVNEAISDNYYYSKTKSEIRYSPMGNWFELGNTKIENADVATFEVLSREFAKDKNHIFYKEYSLDEEVDYNTFKSFDYYALDKNNVYIPNEYGRILLEENTAAEHTKLVVVKGANPNFYQQIDSDWAKDEKAFFYRHQKINVDYTSFEVLNHHFCKDKNLVYGLKTQQVFPLSCIDVHSVVRFDDDYITDKNNLYLFSEYVDAKITDTLYRYSYKNPDQIKKISKFHLQLDDRIYYETTELIGVDLNTFQLLSPEWYAKDKNQVYCGEKIIQDADPKTFSIFEQAIYTKDKNHVYCRGIILQEADVNTFGPPTKKYKFLYQDKNHAYRDSEIMDKE